MSNNSQIMEVEGTNGLGLKTETETETETELNENPSLCIPRVYKDISIPFIANVFQNKLQFGIVKRIHIVPNINDKNFKKVFIHFDFWYDSEEANDVKHKLLNGTTIKIIYDMPWFWKCSLNRYTNTNTKKHKNKT